MTLFLFSKFNYRFANRLTGDKKKIGSNPLLRDKKIVFNPSRLSARQGGAWRILTEFNLANRAAGAENSKHPIWLHLLDKIRIFFQENPDSDL